jgi:hypothetical protein
MPPLTPVALASVSAAAKRQPSQSCDKEYLCEDDLYETAREPIDHEAFLAAWTDEAEEAANTVDTETIRLATALLLPIWSSLPANHLSVNRIVDGAGNSWLGRLVYDEHVVPLFTKLGVDRAEALPPGNLAKAIMAGSSIDLARPFSMTFKRAMVNGKHRIEIGGAPYNRLEWLKSLGYFAETIQYMTRLFVPIDDAPAILAWLTG